MMGYSMGSSMTMRSIPILFALVAGTVFVSCSRDDAIVPHSRKGQDSSDTGQTTLQKPAVALPAPENPNWAILTKADFSEKLLDALGAQEAWRPTESDVRHALRDVRRYLEKLKKTTNWDYEQKQIEEILAQWETYACQAIGYIKDGKELIHLNFLPRTEKDWRRAYICPLDGGASFWRIEYDKNTKSFSHFSANGVA
jgi:hypothetical protein